MSRIAGLCSSRTDPQRTSLVDEMLAASCATPAWGRECHPSGDAVLGWGGWQMPNVAKINDVIVVMDGCIHNRQELGAAETDASVLARLYLTYGWLDALRRLNGDFAAALYDPHRDTLWLARDRFGVKPLYYTVKGAQVAFASRPRALLALTGVSRAVNRRFVALFAASHYRTFDNDPEQSPYAEIAQLPAGHLLQVTGGTVIKRAYWSLEIGADSTLSEHELARRYRELLLDAIAMRFASASKPIFTLSGGMDSSSVLACAVRVAGAKQHAISTVYEDATYDESREIRSMVETTVAQWHPVQVGTPDVLALVTDMISHHDEPVATATWLSHYLLCQEAKRLGFHSLFGGLGGDELNAGEYEHFFFFFADLRAAGREADLSHETSQWVAHHDHPVFRKSVEVMGDGLARLVDLTRPGKCLVDERRVGRYAAALNPDYFDLSEFEPVMDEVSRSYLKNRVFQDLFRETIPCCLRAEDRQTTAWGLENFLPFLDYRLVEFMFQVPSTLNIRDGVTKYLLRQAMRGILPEETRTRVKKMGWNAPAHRWFSGRGKELLMDLVHSQTFQQRGIYHVGEVDRLIEEHDRIVSSGVPQENHMMFLWQLVNLELWFQQLQSPRP